MASAVQPTGRPALHMRGAPRAVAAFARNHPVPGKVNASSFGVASNVTSFDLAVAKVVELHRPDSTWEPGLKVPWDGLLLGSQRTLTVNTLDGRYYPHHPVMLQVPLKAFPMDPSFLVEWNGLRVPAKYDCDIFNGGHGWGNHRYFFEVPTRWYACYRHQAAISSGLLTEVPELPMVDDEYAEHVSVYHSVLRAKVKRQRNPSYSLVVAEIGARWGTWGSRAVAFWREVAGREAAYTVLSAEMNPLSCEAISHTGWLNSIQHKLVCGAARAADISKWIDTVDHVDMIDLDVQGAEGDILGDQRLLARFDKKVARLIIGTHSRQIHLTLSATFARRGWRTVWNVQQNPGEPCVWKHLRGDYQTPNSPARFDWKAMLDQHCFHYSPRGPVAHADGEIIVDNPRLVDVAQGFSLADSELKIGDLL